MFTNQQADYLVNLSKKIVENDVFKETVTFKQEFPFRKNFILASEEDNEFIFLFEINQSSKNQLKLTLLFQEDESKIGLLRVDFNGKHKNPETVNNTLPEVFIEFAGKWFDYNEHHIHYFVEGYSPLAWAIPLTNDTFPVKDLLSNTDIIDSIKFFCEKIKLKSEIIINEILL